MYVTGDVVECVNMRHSSKAEMSEFIRICQCSYQLSP